MKINHFLIEIMHGNLLQTSFPLHFEGLLFPFRHIPFCSIFSLKCPKSDKVMRHEIVVLSDDLKHDTFAVASFEKVAVAELQACGVEFEVLIEFDDGAASQYKCINSFEDISKSVSRLGVKVKRAYFGAWHGKGQSDGATAVVKSSVRRAVTQGRIFLMQQQCTVIAKKTWPDHALHPWSPKNVVTRVVYIS